MEQPATQPASGRPTRGKSVQGIAHHHHPRSTNLHEPISERSVLRRSGVVNLRQGVFGPIGQIAAEHRSPDVIRRHVFHQLQQLAGGSRERRILRAEPTDKALKAPGVLQASPGSRIEADQPVARLRFAQRRRPVALPRAASADDQWTIESQGDLVRRRRKHRPGINAGRRVLVVALTTVNQRFPYGGTGLLAPDRRLLRHRPLTRSSRQSAGLHGSGTTRRPGRRIPV